MKNDPLVSVVIPTHNRKEKLKRLLLSLEKSSFNNLEFLVIDDASVDGTYEEIRKEFPEVKVFRNDKEKLLAATRNIGVRNARGDYIILIDDDNIVHENCIENLLKFTQENREAGIVAPLMYYYSDPNRIWSAGGEGVPLIGSFRPALKEHGKIDRGQYKKPISVESHNNVFMVRKEVFTRVGYFDEENFPTHCDDQDFSLRAKRYGYRLFVIPEAKVWHDRPFSPSQDRERGISIRSIKHVYYYGRNPMLMKKRYMNRYFVSTTGILYLTSAIPFLLTILRSSDRRKTRLIKAYIKGILDGITNSIKA